MDTKFEDMKPFNFDYGKLDDITFFYWLYEYTLEHFHSNEYNVMLAYQFPEFERDWGGYTMWIQRHEKSDSVFALTGLTYHPDTRTGIFFGVKKAQNTKIYDKVFQSIPASGSGYETDKSEIDFLKLYMPEKDVEELMKADSVDAQIGIMSAFFESCCKAVLAAQK